MTKLDFSSLKKPEQETPPEDNSPQYETEPHTNEEKSKETDRRICSTLASLGITVQDNDENLGMDWAFISKIGNIQFTLAMISSGCLMLSMSFTGFNFLRFTSSAWSTYVLCTAYIAIRAGRWRSYAHAIAFTGMVCFQTVVYMSSLCWLIYSLYALDYHMHVYRMGEHIGGHLPDVALFLIVIEVVSLIGTVFTGTFGLIACCRGFGKLIDGLERMIMEQRYATTPQITLRPIV